MKRDDSMDKYEGLIDVEGYIDYDGIDTLLAEVERLHYWIYHHAKNLDAGGVHTFADEAREVIGLVKGEVRDYEHR